MSTYTTIPTLADGNLLTAAHMEILKADIDIIRTPGRYYYLKGAGEADLTEASTTFNDIAAPFTVADLDTSGNPVRVMLYAGRHTTTATLSELDLIVDGLSVRGGTPVWRGATNVPIMFTWIVDGLAAGPHDYNLQWRINGAGTTTIYSAYGIWFEIREE